MIIILKALPAGRGHSKETSLGKTGPRAAVVSDVEEQRGSSLQGRFECIDAYALRRFHYPSAASLLLERMDLKHPPAFLTHCVPGPWRLSCLGGRRSRNSCFQSLREGEAETEAKEDTLIQAIDLG